MMGVRKLWVPESSDIDVEGVHHSYPEIREWLKTWINHESSDLGFFWPNPWPQLSVADI